MAKKQKKSNFLKLHPHKHTGKLLHHRHTSYPALFVVLALAGAVLFAPVEMARADSYLVSAVVPAPLPTDSATITSPADNSVVSQPNVTVRGTCPVVDPPIIVVLYDGSNIIGSQYCAGDGTFAILVTLSPGSHSLVPRIVNFTGQDGATGTATLVTYLPPVAVTTTTTTTAVTTHTTDTLPHIITDSAYVLYGPHKDAVWKGTVQGGTPPYGITVNWGDGSIEKIHAVKPGPLALKHHYSSIKIYQLRVELRDSAGLTTGISLIALSPAIYNTDPEAAAITGNTTLSRNWLLYALYILTVVALTLLWHRERTRNAYQPVLVPVAKRRQPVAKPRRR